jgi:iron complex outermembrane recepter protein
MPSIRPIGAALAVAAYSHVGVALAQEKPSDPTASTSTPEFVERLTVTASPLARGVLELAQPATVLRGDALRRAQAATIGDTLSGEVGVSSSYFGPGAGRPIIRGLDGPRIRVLQDGIGTLDASTVSPDHEVTTETLGAEQVEILRGPATLLYGGGAIGGVVNVVTRTIPSRSPAKPVTGSIELRGQTVNDESTVGAAVDGSAQSMALHVDGFHRRQKDYRIPGNAIRDDPESPSGRLPNSFLEQSGGTAGASFIGNRGFVGLSASLLDAQYGIPTEERVFIGLHQKRLGLAAEVDEPFAFARRARMRAALVDYQHIEYAEDKSPGTTFTNKGFEARGELPLVPMAGWSSVLGMQGFSHELAAVGEEAVIPKTRSSGAGIFALTEHDLDARWRLDLGLRVDSERRRPEGDLPARNFTPVQAAAGLVFDRRDGYVVAMSTTYAQRTPSIEELYSNGPHAATATFDLGDPLLRKETSFNLDLSLRKTNGPLTGTLGIFANKASDFVFGAFVDADGDGVADRVDEEGEPDPDGEFLVQQFTAGSARFYGVEGELVYRPSAQGVWGRVFGDYTRGRLSHGGGNLPRMPAARVGAELAYTAERFTGRLLVMHGFRQDRTAALESATPSYTRVDVDVSYTLTVGIVQWQLFARGLNLTDEDIRVATSYLKDVAPLPGRSLIAGVRATFD